MKYQLYLINTEKKHIVHDIIMTFVRVMIAQLFPHTVKPNQGKYTTSMYTGQLFVICIQPLHFGGALEKTFTLASPQATIVCFMVRTWSRTKSDSRCVKKKKRKSSISQVNTSSVPFYEKTVARKKTENCLFHNSTMRFVTLRPLS